MSEHWRNRGSGNGGCGCAIAIAAVMAATIVVELIVYAFARLLASMIF